MERVTRDEENRPARQQAARLPAAGQPAARGSFGALQRSLGNFGLARLITSRIQRQGPLGGGTRGPSLLGDARLTLDPEIEAQMRAIQAMQGALTPAALKPNLLQLPANIAQPPPPGPLQGPSPPQAPPLVPRGAGPKEPKAASGGDLLEAVMDVPAIDTAITNLRTQALDRVRRDWRDLGTGDKAAVVTSLALISGGTLAGVISDPEARNFALSQLNGRVLPVPGVGGLGVELNTEGNNVMVGLHLDIGRYLPESLGFGPGSPSAIGAPPGGPR